MMANVSFAASTRCVFSVPVNVGNPLIVSKAERMVNASTSVDVVEKLSPPRGGFVSKTEDDRNPGSRVL